MKSEFEKFTQNKQTELVLGRVFSKLNMSLTQAERRKFNYLKSLIYCRLDLVEGYLKFKSVNQEDLREYFKCLEEATILFAYVPYLMKD